MKYVVLARDLDGTIVNSFGVFKRKYNAENKRREVREKFTHLDYVVEEVDPLGSYADEECEDE